MVKLLNYGYKLGISSLPLLIFKTVICTKLDYRSFLFVLASYVHRKKLNTYLASCFQSIVNALRSTPSAYLEVEYVCPPVECC